MTPSFYSFTQLAGSYKEVKQANLTFSKLNPWSHPQLPQVYITQIRNILGQRNLNHPNYPITHSNSSAINPNPKQLKIISLNWLDDQGNQSNKTLYILLLYYTKHSNIINPIPESPYHIPAKSKPLFFHKKEGISSARWKTISSSSPHAVSLSASTSPNKQAKFAAVHR